MKTVIIGGTGTLGKELARQLRHEQITIFSRDELKQQEMKRSYPDLEYVIGDVRDRDAVEKVLEPAEVCFHVAALKHVDICEDNPEESVKTNILGTMNVVDACVKHGVNIVFSSTDKAVDPINVYGQCKAISERMVLNAGGSVFRWGNVLGSRGSAIHFFAKTLMEEKKVYITHADMTRFWIKIGDAAGFMLKNYTKNQVMVPDLKAAPISQLIRCVSRVVGVEDFRSVIVGMRKGEKIHERLWSEHSFLGGLSSLDAPRFTDDELIELIRGVL